MTKNSNLAEWFPRTNDGLLVLVGSFNELALLVSLDSFVSLIQHLRFFSNCLT